jgi:hypothetical protein
MPRNDCRREIARRLPDKGGCREPDLAEVEPSDLCGAIAIADDDERRAIREEELRRT